MSIRLRHVATYRDGGSKSFVDNKGNHYWQCFRINHRNASCFGKLFVGRIDDKLQKLAVGEFTLVETRYSATEVETTP